MFVLLELMYSYLPNRVIGHVNSDRYHFPFDYTSTLHKFSSARDNHSLLSSVFWFYEFSQHVHFGT